MKGFRRDGTPRRHLDGTLYPSAEKALFKRQYKPPIPAEPEPTDLEDDEIEEGVRRSLAEIQALSAQREAKALDKVQPTEPRPLTPEDVSTWMKKTPVRLAMRALTQILRYNGQDPKLVALKLEACTMVLGNGDASAGKSKFNTLIGEVNVAIGQFVENQIAPMLPEGVNGEPVHDINALPGREEVAAIPAVSATAEGEQEQAGGGEGAPSEGGPD
jgi:hypothetical protein